MTGHGRPVRPAHAGRPALRIAVIGAGWAGLAAAVQAVQQGARVTLIELAAQPGGRARQLHTPAGDFDNGQHILIGAYTHTLALMRQVGAEPDALLLRRPLRLVTPDGRGLALGAGHPVPAFARAVLQARGWRWADRLALLRAASGWWWHGFACPPMLTVGQLVAHLPATVRHELVEPLCVAALNTPANQASATVFLRVLKDALFSGPGAADLLLPRVPLSALLPAPAWRWLVAAGADCRAGRRVMSLTARSTAPPDAPGCNGWQVDGEPFDAVVLASSAKEAARLVAPVNPAWAQLSSALRHEPIVTAYLADAGLRLDQPMLALPGGPRAPAQFVFDLGALGGEPGCFAFVVSGAAPWLADGLAGCAEMVLQQAQQVFAGSFQGTERAVLRHIGAERRATFACTPGLHRPPMAIAPGLVAAGDYLAGPYPATLEGAVRSGGAAARALV